MRRFIAARLIGALVGFAVLAVATTAAPLIGGLYRLHNHPDGNARPPLYGLRLDELYNETSGHDVFTFDFDHALSSVTMNYDDANQILTITGVSWGGRDIGSNYANDAYLGLYTFSFTYNVGLGLVPGDDDLWVTSPSGNNSGTITTPLGHTKILRDLADNGYTFRLGDENNDLGHRGFAGISGWGWLDIDGHHRNSQDWIFTAELIPEPSSAMLLSIAALTLGRSRRYM